MSLPTHPLLTLVDHNENCLKSMLIHYILNDAMNESTVAIAQSLNNQFASIRNSIETMIRSGVIGSNSDVTAFGTTSPPPTQTNTDQSSAQCSHEYSNDTLTRALEHQNNLLNEVSLANTINTNYQIKREFDDDEEDGEEIDDDNVEKCENCEKGICTSGDDAEMRENEDERFETQHNFHTTLENQTDQLIISKDILPSPSPTNPTNTEQLIKQEYLQGSSITSIPLDFNRNASLNNIFIDEQIERQNTQIQTDEFNDNDYVDDDGNECDENEHLNQPNCANGVRYLYHGSNNNHLNSEVPAREGDETKHDAAQLQVNFSVTNNTQTNVQYEEENVINERSVSERNMEQSIASTSGARSSARKQIEKNVFKDAPNSRKRKSDQSNESVKKVKRKNVVRNDEEDTDSDDNDDQEEVNSQIITFESILDTHATIENDDQHNSDESMVIQHEERDANNAIGEKVATECTTNPIQPNLAPPNRHLQCSHCLRLFDRNSKLQQHLRVHTGEHPFQCNLCDKQFSVKWNLTKHQRIHQNIKPFQCDQCDTSFNDKSNLAKHQLIHQNIKRFKCAQCDTQFNQKVNLDNHLLIHSGERPHQCRFCEKSFTQVTNRNNHEQAIHHHVKPYRCKQCGLTVTQIGSIITHIRVVHFGLPPTVKQQRALNIIDERDPRELVEKVIL